MKWRSVMLAAVMFADCVVVWAAAVNFGQFVDDAAAVVWAATVLTDVLGLAVVVAAAAAVLPAVTDVVELPAAATSAAVALTSLASVTVAESFAVESVCGSADELEHATE